VNRTFIFDLCNIAFHAKDVTGQSLRAVIRGFHMMRAENPLVDETIDWFKTEKFERLLPIHCVEFEYLAKFNNAFSMSKLGAGDLIEI
jgi:metal-dependent hydrolase (beta-lactamase superfamily II)